MTGSQFSDFFPILQTVNGIGTLQAPLWTVNRTQDASSIPPHNGRENVLLVTTIMSMAVSSEIRETALIEVSAKDRAIPNRKLTGTVRTNEKKILTVITDEEIAGSAAVRVQTEDLLMFGEILGCIPEQDAKWTVYVGVKRRMLIV